MCHVLHSPQGWGVVFSKLCSPNQVLVGRHTPTVSLHCFLFLSGGTSHPQCLCTASCFSLEGCRTHSVHSFLFLSGGTSHPRCLCTVSCFSHLRGGVAGAAADRPGDVPLRLRQPDVRQLDHLVLAQLQRKKDTYTCYGPRLILICISAKYIIQQRYSGPRTKQVCHSAAKMQRSPFNLNLSFLCKARCSVSHLMQISHFSCKVRYK